MAETKYSLLLVPTADNSRVKPQPWYRERLKTKYDKPDKNKQWKPSLATSSWTFIQDGLDDFRDGLPPPVSDSTILRGTSGLSPNIVGGKPRDGNPPKQSSKKALGKEETHFMRTLPLKNRGRERVKTIELSLLNHPLALYPHLEESVAPDVFEDVVELLDPAFNLSDVETELHCDTPSGSAHSVIEEDAVEEEVSVFDESPKTSSPLRYSHLEESTCSRYKWLPSPRDSPKEERSTRTAKKRPESLSQNKKIEEVTRDFCGWVRDLGGNTNNIEESTVYSLFASGYETKPTLSVPLHVVELTNVPPELRSGTTNPQAVAEQTEATSKAKGPGYTPSWVKVKYGAWYLDPKSWKVMEPGEPLQDPKTMDESQHSESKQKARELDKVLTGLHGARAFKEFVDRKGARKPEFLDFVNQPAEESDQNRPGNLQSGAQDDQAFRGHRSRANTNGSHWRSTSSKEQ